jgi:hypothetical protein
MEERLPLTEVGGDEILARVTYQIIASYYRDYPDSFDNPTEAVLNLANTWYQSEIPIIAEQMTLVAIWLSNGGTIATWRRARIVFHAGRSTRLAQAGRSRRR